MKWDIINPVFSKTIQSLQSTGKVLNGKAKQNMESICFCFSWEKHFNDSRNSNIALLEINIINTMVFNGLSLRWVF